MPKKRPVTSSESAFKRTQNEHVNFQAIFQAIHSAYIINNKPEEADSVLDNLSGLTKEETATLISSANPDFSSYTGLIYACIVYPRKSILLEKLASLSVAELG